MVPWTHTLNRCNQNVEDVMISPINVIIILMLFSMAGYVWRKKRVFFEQCEILDDGINSFIQLHNLSTVDLELEDLNDCDCSRGKSKTTYMVEGVMGSFDVIKHVVEAGYKRPSHKHLNSNEFIYVLSGKLDISLSDVVETTVLSESQWLLIPSGVFHSVSASGDAVYMSIVQPSIFEAQR